MKKISLSVVSVSLLSLLMLSFSAQSASLMYCYGEEKPEYLLDWTNDIFDDPDTDPHTVTFYESMSGVWDNLTVTAASSWNKVNSNHLTINIKPSTVSPVVNNEKNDILFRSIGDPSILGMTYLVKRCKRDGMMFPALSYLKEAEVWMNVDVNWTTSTKNVHSAYSYFNPSFSFLHVMTHELGHAIGLDHTVESISVMNPSYPNGGTSGKHDEVLPHGSDAKALNILYPSTEAYKADLSVSRYRYKAINGEDSVNSFIKNTVKEEIYLQGYGTYHATTNIVKPGNNYLFDYTVENLSSEMQNARVRAYISKDENLTARDIEVGGSIRTISGFGAISATTGLYVPEDTPEGVYYVGYTVESYLGMSDPNLNNNQVVLADKITVSHEEDGSSLP